MYIDTTSLAAGTTYRYQVRAVDAAGNLGPSSNVASATTATPPVGLVAAYSFDEGSGSTVADASGFGNNGTVSATTWSTQGKFGNALSFNGTSSIVNIANSSSLQLGTAMTLEAWVNPAATSAAWRDVVYKGNDNYYLMGTTDRNGGFPAGGGTFGGANANALGNAVLPANSWSFIATTFDGAMLRFYVNGALVGSQVATGPIATSTNPLQIGGDSLFGQHFNGLIDEVRVYSTALPASLIQADMNTAVAGAAPSIPANLTRSSIVDRGRPDLGGVVRSRRRHRLRGRALPGSGLHELRADRHAEHELVQRHRCHRRTRPSSIASRGVDAAGQKGALLGHRHGVHRSSGQSASGLADSFAAAAVRRLASRRRHRAAHLVRRRDLRRKPDGRLDHNGGLYTAGTAAGAHTITATSTDQTTSSSATAYVGTYAGTYTIHNDNQRTGQDSSESALSPSTVNAASFGKLASRPLDGIAYASPLYVANVSVPGQGVHNIVYVATEHDSVYAYDADSTAQTPLWKDSFIDAAHGITTVPAGDTGECCDIAPEIGITGTPVIDPSTNTLFVVAATKEVVGGSTTYPIRLHALDLSTGAEKFGGPVAIQATVPGNGAGSEWRAAALPRAARESAHRASAAERRRLLRILEPRRLPAVSRVDLRLRRPYAAAHSGLRSDAERRGRRGLDGRGRARLGLER